jgi:hypothetical protein
MCQVGAAVLWIAPALFAGAPVALLLACKSLCGGESPRPDSPSRNRHFVTSALALSPESAELPEPQGECRSTRDCWVVQRLTARQDDEIPGQSDGPERRTEGAARRHLKHLSWSASKRQQRYREAWPSPAVLDTQRWGTYCVEVPLAFRGWEAVMKMRSLRWNLVAWNPSAGPADPHGAPRFAYLAWAARTHWRPICLVTGGFLMLIGLVLPSPVAFVAGMLAVGSSAPDARLHSVTAARVRAWAWLDKRATDHR